MHLFLNDEFLQKMNLYSIIVLYDNNRGALHMITGELRNKVDRIWESFWTGGITNPLTVIEQFTYLLYIKGLDDREKRREMDSELLGTTHESLFPEDQPELRWSTF